MSDYRIWVNFTRFKISWKAGGLKNPKPEKSVLFLNRLFRALANAHVSHSPAQDVSRVLWAALLLHGAGRRMGLLKPGMMWFLGQKGVPCFLILKAGFTLVIL